MDLFDRLRKLDMSLCPEPTGEWSVLDSANEQAWFGSTPEEAISNAEQGVQVDGKAATMHRVTLSATATKEGNGAEGHT